MRRTEAYVIVGTLVAAAVIAMAGCGGTGPLLGDPGGQPIWSLDIPQTGLEPVPDPGQALRWLDIADHQYADLFIGGLFQYTAGTVQLSGTDGASLDFTVSTLQDKALKPNFCYQMKLEGPAEQWGTNPDSDFVNGEFGYNGRWWCDSCNASLTDRTVKVHMRRQHVVKGYLYFDFFVTDANGTANYTAPVVNSYHVTWKTTQRTPGANDGPIRDCTVVARTDGWAYDQNYTDENGEVVSLYGEWEPNRALPGELALAPGSYAGVQFRLTEESFHASGIGGNWATVMAADGISFEITGGGPGPETHDVAVAEIGVSPRLPIAGQPAAVAVTVANEGTEPEDTDVSLSDTSDGSAIIVPSSPQPVSLPPGASTTLEFTWTPAQAGFHVLEARAAEVPEETDTGDNVNSRKVRVR